MATQIETIIKTANSSLDLITFDDPNLLIPNCISDINDKLIEHPEIIIKGKTLRQRRSIGFFSDSSIGYEYSGQVAKSQKLTDNLIQLLNMINELFGSEFNGILINKYVGGKETIGKHSDDERFLDKAGVVSISYGASRKFRIREKSSNIVVKDIQTSNNIIIHMKGNFQKEFTHEIPIEPNVAGIRYSFTFRKHLK